MAGLMGMPTVALFGPTDPARWAPRGRPVTVIQGAPLPLPSWDAVSRCRGEALSRVIAAGPSCCLLYHPHSQGRKSHGIP